ncbi:MAG: orotidine-5'-phosphate decarboxylase [Bdellovibrionia bacterium]
MRVPEKKSTATELIVALDFPRVEPAWECIEALKGLPVIFKVGLELYMHGGSDWIRELVHQKKRVFLDLKFHDIPQTVARAAHQAALLHVEMFTLHLLGGSAMIQAVNDELAEFPALKPRVLGVSVLTSFDDVRWAEVTRALTGHAMEVSHSVEGLVNQLPAWGGVDGVVCSALELSEIRAQYPHLYTVVPGIRPQGSPAQDQARVTTPEQAKKWGASAIVVGRPITQAADPRGVAEAILAELQG